MTAKPDPFRVALNGKTMRLEAQGSLVASQVDAQRVALKEHLLRAEQTVVLDLSASEMVDSLGITLVVGLFKTCQERRLAFSVEGANTEILRLFRFFCLNEVFEIREP